MNNNWRDKIGNKKRTKDDYWELDFYNEFMDLVDNCVAITAKYNWNFWGSGSKNRSITASQWFRDGKSISLLLKPTENYHYYACFENVGNPNNLKNYQYTTFVGETLEEALKYLENYIIENSNPLDYENDRICVEGKAYDDYYFRAKWIQDAMIEELGLNKMRN